MANFNVNLPPAPSENEGGNEFSLINLASGAAESDDDASLASTLYDPAALTLDPKMRAQLEAEAEEKDRRRERGEDVDEYNPKDIALSPASPVPGKNPFQVDEENEDALVDESPLCCCGLIPLRGSIYAINIVNILLAIFSVAFGLFQVATREQPSTDGFGTLDSLLLAGPRYVNTALVIGGALLVIAGIVGIVLASDLTFGSDVRSKKFSILLYQAIVLLVGLIFCLLAGLVFYALNQMKGKDIYDVSHWRGQVQDEPSVVCQTEISGQCAGFTANNECLLAFSEVLQQQQNCPGHFCYDFCQVRETIQNSNPKCQQCSLGYDWLQCKKHEGSVDEGKGCGDHINGLITSGYSSSVGIVIAIVVTVLATLSVVSFRSCCLAPVDT